MPIDINKHEVDIDTLKKQNVNDLISIKELYRKLKEMEKKISQIKYIDSKLADKLKKDYENLKRIILNENIQTQLTNDVNEINTSINKINNDINEVSSQLDNIENEVDFLKENKLGFIAHRGSHILAPENTIKAIHLAGELGYEFVELDVQYTSDNIPVLMHDDTIDRTTNGSGKVSDFTYNQLLNFIVDEDYVGKDTDEIIRIPHFDDCIKGMQKYNLGINLDCSKIAWNIEKINDIVNRLKKYGIFNRCFFVLTDDAQRDLLTSLYPNACVTWLTYAETVDQNIAKYKKYKNAFITCSINTITQEQLEIYKANNIPIFLYECNTLDKCYKYSGYGVRFIETDKFLPKEVK